MAKFGKWSVLLKCSFCGTSQKPGSKLIAGPDVYICNERISLYSDITETTTNGRTGPGR